MEKKSIFFDLPYRSDHHVRHCIDVMHVEKNVCDSLIGTLLNIKGKTKDGLKCRQDLVDMGIRQVLHPVSKGPRTYLPQHVTQCQLRRREVFVNVCVVSKSHKDTLQTSRALCL